MTSRSKQEEDEEEEDKREEEKEDEQQHQQQQQQQQQQQNQQKQEQEKNEVVYGPFHRIASPTQSNAVANLQVQSQEIWGRPRRGSDIPQVQAYIGPLPDNEKGIEFVTYVVPDKHVAPGQARWTGPREGVRVKDDFCRIPVRITKNTQTSTIVPTVVTAVQ